MSPFRTAIPFSSMRHACGRVSVLLITAFCWLHSKDASAADGTWSQDTAGTYDWSTAGNWASGTIPGSAGPPYTNGDTAIFNTPTTTGTLVTIDANRSIRSIVFGPAGSGFTTGSTIGAFTIGSAGANLGESLHLSNGGSITMQGYTTAPTAGTLKTQTINAPLILEGPASGNGTYSFINNANNLNTNDAATAPAAGKMIINGSITGSGTSSTNITLTLGGNVGTRSAGSSPANNSNFINGLIANGSANSLAVTIDGSAPATNRFNAWTLTNAANSYTGATTVNTGALYFNRIANKGINSAIGAGTAVNVGTNGQFIYYGGTASTDRDFTFDGGAIYNQVGTSVLTLNGAFTTNPGGSPATFRGAGTIQVNSLITGLGGIGRTDGSTVFLNNNANSFSGAVTMSDGFFSSATIADAGVNSGFGSGSVFGFGQSSTTTGGLRFTGASGGSSNRLIRLDPAGTMVGAGNGRIENTVAGQTLTLSGNVVSNALNSTVANRPNQDASLTLQGDGNGVLSGVVGGLLNNEGTATKIRITKTGSGTWSFNNSNIYFGGTTVSGGALLANNTAGSATGTGNVNITNATLGGGGSITGGSASSITLGVNSFLMVGNTRGLAAGAVSSSSQYVSAVADLHLGATNITFDATTTLHFDLFGNDVDSITAAEADRLFITSGTVALNGKVSVFDATGTAGSWTSGTWKLVDWGTAAKSGNFTTYELPTIASGYTWFTDDFQTTGNISIVAAVPEPGRVMLFGIFIAALAFRRRRAA